MSRDNFLRDYQKDAVEKMRNGCILNGGVGSGKSRTGLYYYFKENGGKIEGINNYTPMKNPKDLYIITTARKRDTFEWETELGFFHLSTVPEFHTLYNNIVIVDSWNNISKYLDVQNAFFIFDEQRVVGYGAWVKSFLTIAKRNNWILLSATPGDSWIEYVPVFIANGYYKDKSEFIREHVVYARVVRYPKIDRYVNVEKLIKLRDKILVDMNFSRPTIAHHEDITVSYNIKSYKETIRNRWNPFTNVPIRNASELCYTLRKIVNSDMDRSEKVLDIFLKHSKVIIFYNFDYELEILLSLNYGKGVKVAEWNGHKHQPLPETEKWVYLVQYSAGAEGWNCISTNVIIFFSQNYSYKILQQAAGRIDRLNTTFIDLYYYHLKSKSSIDLAISRAVKNKKKFNERKFVDIN